MSPPVYGDLGKQSRDVFGKGYHFGVLKLECKTKSDTGVEVTAGGSNAVETGKVSGNLETKYKLKEHGELILFIIRPITKDIPILYEVMELILHFYVISGHQ